MTQPYHHGALRTALILAAEKILDRDGLEALTLRAVAREARVSHAAPAHHFGDLTGLLTELAASGFVRIRQRMMAEMKAVGACEKAHLIALGRGYVEFAQASPGLFRLMFRSERLDWSVPALVEAGGAAFAMLTEQDSGMEKAPSQSEQNYFPTDLEGLVTATTRWSLVHGLATLLIDARLGPISQKVPGTEIDLLIEQVLSRGLA